MKSKFQQPYTAIIIGLLVVGAAAFLFYAATQGGNPGKTPVSILTGQGPVVVNAEVADSQEEWQRGLMFRESMPQGDGMIFVFPEQAQRSFWMKNTKIPLDIIFISQDMAIVDIKKGFQPCLQDPCEVYVASGTAKYVLEVNAGFSDVKGVSIGNTVSLQGI